MADASFPWCAQIGKCWTRIGCGGRSRHSPKEANQPAASTGWSYELAATTLRQARRTKACSSQRQGFSRLAFLILSVLPCAYLIAGLRRVRSRRFEPPPVIAWPGGPTVYIRPSSATVHPALQSSPLQLGHLPRFPLQISHSLCTHALSPQEANSDRNSILSSLPF